jgi:hypothetical protein
MSRDILAEFLPWTPLASHAATQWLDQHNLPSDVDRLADALYGQPGPFGLDHASIELVIGAAPVRPAGDALFEIDDGGAWSALQPVDDASGEVVDIIAWRPAEPEHWRFLTGEGEALGLIELDVRLEEDGPIICYASPLSWLRADGRGLCLLTDDWAVVQRILIGERTVGAETSELGRRLDKILRYRPSPEILVVEQAA